MYLWGRIAERRHGQHLQRAAERLWLESCLLQIRELRVASSAQGYKRAPLWEVS
jgi:hypothetical protein